MAIVGAGCVDLACSWQLPVGRDADIRIALYGTRAGIALKNVGGSFINAWRTKLVTTRPSHGAIRAP